MKALESESSTGKKMQLTSQLQSPAERIGMRDDFLSMACHALRSPLTPLKIQVQTLRRMSGKGRLSELAPEKVFEMLSNADRQIGRLEDVIENILEATAIRSGKFHLDLKEADLAALAQEAIDSVRLHPSFLECSIDLTCPSGVTGYLDPVRIKRALLNVLTNALIYGLGRPVQIDVLADNDSAHISVHDYGVGITAGDQERIFDPFERASSSDHYDGLGLGLFVARNIMRAHGGNMRVASAPGMGSTFSMTLPLRPPVASRFRSLIVRRSLAA
jgi:signal transduction histidine kinase